MLKFFFLMLLAMLLSGCWVQSKSSGEEKLLLATTTSTYDSGLLDELIPVYEETYDTSTDVISVGSGEALMMAETGEADALFTHAPEDEAALEDQGAVINRQRVMYNDFVIVGLETDPAKISGKSVQDVLQTIHQDEDTAFFSRGDDSGTHKKELDLWGESGLTPENDNYQETGQGMGDTLRITAEKQGYTLTDRGTYLSLRHSLDELDILAEGDDDLQNIYHVMQVNPEKSEQINAGAAENFVEFMTSEKAQSIIENYGQEKWGESLFTPDAEEG